MGLSVFLFIQIKKLRNSNIKVEINDPFHHALSSQIILNTASAEKINTILEQCRVLAIEIDEVTGRKNCSQNVAEIVYRISKYSGFEESISQLHYCAALVYDAGFLRIDKGILQLPEISSEQFNLLQTHTSLAREFLDFVPEEWRQLFFDAAEKHHENIDGSGYPYQLSEKDIPYIARVIRVAESYEAMVSPREYRKIMDHDTALEYLITRDGIFDKKILEVMEKVI
ncbi:MAG: HD domain-containing protein [Spirochaetales bacterium]|nr:HD domain-containing protein [Spirochaetales bacterium]